VAHVRLFAAAAEACGMREATIDARTLGALLDDLGARGMDAVRVLRQCAVIVDGLRVDLREAPLAPDARVDVLPPFAGG
jgi:molybdopterin synthase sulfur carrier subunit